MPSPNDSCSSATSITALPFSEAGIDLTAATAHATDPSEPMVNEGNGALFRTVWYQYTPATDQRVHLNVSNSDVAIGVFTGSCGSLTEVASWVPDLTVDLVAGTTYRIMFGTFDAANETFDFTMEETTVPANQLMSTAVDMEALRFEESYNLTNVVDNGSSRDLWFRYTAKPGEAVVSILGYQGVGGSTVDPVTTVWTGPVSLYNPQAYRNATSFGNSRVQIPVTAGTTYYFRVRTFDAGTPVHSVLVKGAAAPEMAFIPRGHIIVNSDADDFPAAVVDPETGLVKGFRTGMIGGETGDILKNGRVLLNKTTGDPDLVLYRKSLHVLAEIDGIEANVGSGNQLDTFYMVTFESGDRYVRSLSSDGEFLEQYGPLPSASQVLMVAVTRDETIAYLTQGLAIGSGGGKVLKWDLVNDVQLSDFAAGVTNYNLFGAGVSPGGLLVLEDGSVLVAYWRTNLADSKIIHYSAAGAVLHTYDFTSIGLIDRIQLDPDDTDGSTFYVWYKPSFGLGSFSKVQVSDGTLLSTVTGPEVQDGYAFKLDADNTELEFGHYFSCPFLVLTQDTFMLDESIPCCPETHVEGWDPCGCPPGSTTGSPSTEPPPSSTGPVLPIDLPIGPADILSEEYWTAQCVGGGEVPLEADPVDAESWAA